MLTETFDHGGRRDPSANRLDHALSPPVREEPRVVGSWPSGTTVT
ncbi:hypothetical protein [Streptomyces sp. NPDC058671]